ncbi:MAG: glycosyltransferase family 4 protein [Kiritimatiellae bacterium]|nr:glycosyltransferase family 4 protein [Kiritimatiellia bacterium]
MSESQRIAFVSPRFADGNTIGGAETLLKSLAMDARQLGYSVDFLATCASNHFTWANEIPPGKREIDGINVHNFPVDDRDAGLFLQLQESINKGKTLSPEDQERWMANSVNSSALYEHLKANDYHRVITGPYLFGLAQRVAALDPTRTVLVPCLHDEAFAYQDILKPMFTDSRTIIFNTHQEQRLATQLYGQHSMAMPVVGMGIEPFTADPNAFAERHGLKDPYVIYCGRREELKGTPLLLDYLNAYRSRTAQDLKLVLTGSGEFHPPEDLAPHILDVGFVSESEKHEAMAGALAFIHPSQLESLGIVLLEAWLASTPALVHSGSPVLVDQCRQSKGGLWFRSYADFEECLMRLQSEPAIGEALAKQGRAFVVERYSPEAVRTRFSAALAR